MISHETPFRIRRKRLIERVSERFHQLSYKTLNFFQQSSSILTENVYNTRGSQASRQFLAHLAHNLYARH